MTIITEFGFRAAGLALLLVPVAACAQPVDQAATPTTNRAAPHARPGGMTLQAFVARHEARLLADDTDGDGKVSRAEFLAAARAGKGDPAGRFARMDRNGDGMLDKTEIDAALTRRFQRIDANGDGVASADERAAAHGGKGAAKGKDAES